MQAPMPPEREVAIDGKTLRGFCGDHMDTEGHPSEHAAQQPLTAVGIGRDEAPEHVGFSGQKHQAAGTALRHLALFRPQWPP